VTLAILNFNEYVVSTVSAQGESVRVFLSPAELYLPPTNSLSLMIDAKSYEISYAIIELVFDPSLINLTDEIQPSSSLGKVVSITKKEQANSTGIIVIALALSREDGNSPPTGIFEFAQIQLAPVTTTHNQQTSMNVIPNIMEIVNTTPIHLPFTSESASIIVNPNPPPNDDFDFPKLINIAPYADLNDTMGSTTAPDDPPLTNCYRNPGKATVWYKYTPPYDSTIEVDTYGSDYDTMLAVWTGQRNNLTPVNCNDDSGGGLQSWLIAPLTARTTYYIEVAQYNGILVFGESPESFEPNNIEGLQLGGFLSLNVKPTPPPNDGFNSPKVINPPLPFHETLDTSGATSAPEDPPLNRCNRNAGLATVWYRYKPFNRVSIEVNTFGSDYDTILAVWTGSPGNLTLWACNDDTGSLQSWLNATLSAGTTYYIEVAQYNGVLTSGDPTTNSKPNNPERIQSGGTLQLNIKYSNWIFKDGFETDDLSRWTSCITDNSLYVIDDAAIVGDYGMWAFIDDNNPIYCTDDNPKAEINYHARFYFHPKSIPMANSDSHQLFLGYSGWSTKVVVIEFRKSPFGRYQLRTGTRIDNSTWVYSAWFAIYGYRAYPIELYWKAASGPGSNNGSLTFWIDGLQKAILTSLDNDTRKIDRVRLGAVGGIDTGTRGSYYFDDFKSTRLNYIGP